MRGGTIWILAFGWFTATGLLLFSYRYLDDLARERIGTFPDRFIEQMTGAYSSAILFPLIVWFARRFPLDRKRWTRNLFFHFLFMCGFSAAHTTLMAISRQVLFPLASLGSYDYGIMSLRYRMELANDVITYCFFVGVIYTIDFYRAARDRELRTVQLESKLSQAQLQSLRLQLHPHFLFNTLNTISAMGYRGEFPAWCKNHLGWMIEIVKRPSKWGRYLPGVEPPFMPRFTVLKRR